MSNNVELSDAAKGVLERLKKGETVYYDSQSENGIAVGNAAFELMKLGLAKRTFDSFLADGKVVFHGEVVLAK